MKRVNWGRLALILLVVGELYEWPVCCSVLIVMFTRQNRIYLLRASVDLKWLWPCYSVIR